MTGQKLKMQLDVLERDGYHAARTYLVRLLDMDEKERTLMNIRAQAASGAPQQKIRGMWTGWCFSHHVMPGMPEYEDQIEKLIEDSEKPLDRQFLSEYLDEACGRKARGS